MIAARIQTPPGALWRGGRTYRAFTVVCVDQRDDRRGRRGPRLGAARYRLGDGTVLPVGNRVDHRRGADARLGAGIAECRAARHRSARGLPLLDPWSGACGELT
ncbi:hypothetical protein WR25_21828 [Diploscapter pachys]|uniref:Uncharacterized protein n=1 Tax=Diploscapter pachys TaxID=2018661 RepID=A0A2A2KAM3_9BILA|nr:hypothetical protein WR25_21828 [Diploscapter pachys]